MKIAGMTPNEWAKDTLKVIEQTGCAELVLTALVERIAAEVAHEMAGQWISAQAERKMMAQVQAAKTSKGVN
jgi:hypothetical protein